MSARRIEHIGDAELWLADCREVLPALQADALITDPVWPNCPRGLIPGSDDPFRLFRESWAVMPRLKRATIILRHDSDPRFLTPVPLPFARASILAYAMPGYIGRMLGGDELAYSFGEPIPSRPGQRVIPGRASRSAQPSDRIANGHPCSRARPHLDFLVRWWSEPEETVLDPFMGSGTTGVASLSLGRRFIGIEIEKRYFEIACRRIEAEARQPRLPLAEQRKPESIPLPLDGPIARALP